MPKMQFRSGAKPSTYAYPEPLKPPKKEEKEKVRMYLDSLLFCVFFTELIGPFQVTTAVLSVTAKVKARAKKAEGTEEKMEVVWHLLFIV